MTAGELTAICSAITVGLGGVAGTVKWAVSRITTAIESNSAVMIKFVESAARLEVKLDHAAHAAAEVRDFVTEERSQNYDLPIEPSRKTPAKGVREIVRRSPGDER